MQGDTIPISAPLSIKETVRIDGCGESIGQCVTIDAGDANGSMRSRSTRPDRNNVVISGLEITNARRGIYQPVAQGGVQSSGLVVESNLFDRVNKGLELHGNNAVIGDEYFVQGNVFMNAAGSDSAAIELYGENNSVQRNLIGTDAQGTEPDVKFTDGIRVFGPNNHIGATLPFLTTGFRCLPRGMQRDRQRSRCGNRSRPNRSGVKQGDRQRHLRQLHRSRLHSSRLSPP